MGELYSQQALHPAVQLRSRREQPDELNRRLLTTGRLREVHYWVTAGGWTGTWRFSPRVNNIYLLTSNSEYWRPNSSNGYHVSKVGLDIAVVEGMLAEIRLISDAGGMMTGPQEVIWVIEEGV